MCSGMQQGLQSNRCNGIEDSVFWTVCLTVCRGIPLRNGEYYGTNNRYDTGTAHGY